VTINGLSRNSNSTVRVNRFEYFKNTSVKIVAHIILRQVCEHTSYAGRRLLVYPVQCTMHILEFFVQTIYIMCHKVVLLTKTVSYII